MYFAEHVNKFVSFAIDGQDGSGFETWNKLGQFCQVLPCVVEKWLITYELLFVFPLRKSMMPCLPLNMIDFLQWRTKCNTEPKWFSNVKGRIRKNFLALLVSLILSVACIRIGSHCWQGENMPNGQDVLFMDWQMTSWYSQCSLI